MAVALRSSRKGGTEPAGQGWPQALAGSVAGPRHVPVRADEYRPRGVDDPEDRELPRPAERGIDGVDPVMPPVDGERPGLTEVQEQPAGTVQEGEEPGLASDSHQVEVRHAAAEERVAFSEVVADIE